MVMETVTPLTFTYTYYNAPLSRILKPPPLSHPSTLLAGLILVHYLNRAILGPLRTPSRSRTSILVPIAGVIFNLVNGFLLGAYLTSPETVHDLQSAYSRPSFWIGVVMWAFGYAGNILHDEILLNIRREKLKQQKANESSGKGAGEHYSIPHGYLYNYVSYPNYFCEWSEWAGFALAASPANFSSPPWLFFYSEIFLMSGRALRGHKWYKQKFPDYPTDRRVVIPFLF